MIPNQRIINNLIEQVLSMITLLENAEKHIIDKDSLTLKTDVITFRHRLEKLTEARNYLREIVPTLVNRVELEALKRERQVLDNKIKELEKL